jgi:hypothetical protein
MTPLSGWGTSPFVTGLQCKMKRHTSDMVACLEDLQLAHEHVQSEVAKRCNYALEALQGLQKVVAHAGAHA